jgi:DNA repair protein RadA/Sms
VSIFTCSACGAASPKWLGRCTACGEWNTLVEERAPAGRAGGGAGAPAGRLGGAGGARAAAGRPVALRDVRAERAPRLRTGIGELDRVLGGGLVPGSLVLLGGAPGIGKSTLTNMALGHLAAAGRRTLYVSGEESAAQIRLRAERLGAAALDVPVLAETDLDTVLATLDAERPDACVVDSVQTLHSAALDGAPGTVGQVREVATRVTEVAKRSGTAVMLVGHVTKEGALAGPRVLEHLVDCVLQFEGERERTYRAVRALKNRFGSTNDVGVFEMRAGGLVEVLDASARFVGEATRAPGSVVLAAMEGSRPLLVEVQALVSPSELVPPRRGRRTGGRAGRRPRRRPGRGRRREGRGDAPGAAGLLRRDRPDGRAALGRPRRAPARGGGEVRPANDRLSGLCAHRAQRPARRPRGPRADAARGLTGGSAS